MIFVENVILVWAVGIKLFNHNLFCMKSCMLILHDNFNEIRPITMYLNTSSVYNLFNYYVWSETIIIE